MSRAEYQWRPLLINAGEAHNKGIVTYAEDGTVTLTHPRLERPREILAEHQYPLIFPTFLALDKALSGVSNSPKMSTGGSLRNAFDKEYGSYLAQLESVTADKRRWEPDYGNYVFDRRTGDLYLVAPQFWHRVALLTSNAKLLTDPAGTMSAEQIRDKLSATVVGFVGASLGSNVIEAVVREMRPAAAKLADPDYLEATNLNRLQHGSIRYLSRSRACRDNRRNGFEARFVNKAEFVAYENQLVDPYTDWFLYPEGVSPDNLDQFLLGSNSEPRLDYVVEEADDIRIKIEVRRRARKYGIPVLMASDLGHQSQVQFQNFAENPLAPLGFRVSDEELLQRLDRCMNSGDRADLFEVAKGLVGEDFIVDEYAQWIFQLGEQPTNSVPQSGSVAQLSGALSGKMLALHRLGHTMKERVMIDTRHLHMTVDGDAE